MSVWRTWARGLPVAFEGAGFAIPATIGATGLLFAHISPAMVVPGVVAALCALALMHLAAAINGRPLVYAARVLEAATLAGFLEQFVLKMPGWGLEDTAQHRLLLVMLTSMFGALLLPLCYAFRLQRFARMIPAPVFAGFNTAVALALLGSQARVLWASQATDGYWVIAIALGVTLVALLARRWLQGWPPGVTALLAASLATMVLLWGGWHAYVSVIPDDHVPALPVMLVSWSDLLTPQIATLSIVRDLALAGATMALLVFLNTMVAEESIGQLTESPPAGLLDGLRSSCALFLGALMGAPLLSPSVAASRAALQVGPLGWRVLCLVSVLVLLLLGSGALALVPMAGVVGLLLYDAWTAFDRPSLRMFRQWLRGQETSRTQIEDLITVGSVVAAAILFNMVLGVFVGVAAGLVLYAWRNGKRMVRLVATGAQSQSNCTRSRADTRMLAQGAARIRYVELEGALFFGAAQDLQALLRSQFGAGHFLVVDWSHVISADSTVAQAVARCLDQAGAAGTRMALCGLDGAAADVPELCQRAVALGCLFPDADRALEWAENQVIAHSRQTLADTHTSMLDAQSWLQGVAADARTALESALELRLFRAGETVFVAGETSSELMILMQGSVDIVLGRDASRGIRVSRIHGGATMGELGFLDASPRSATALATEDLLVGVLSRSRFEDVARLWPEAGKQVLVNLALDMALRLRRTNQIAMRHAR